MRNLRLVVLLLYTLQGAAQAQSPHFIVSSLKPAEPPQGFNGMAFQRDPGRVAFEKVNLATLLVNATNLGRDLIKGPDWIDSVWFQFSATTPTDTTSAQLREMFQSFLEERFALKYHLEDQELAGYALTVASHGPKLTTATPVPPDQKPPAYTWYFDPPQNGIRIGHFPNCTMRMLAQAIAMTINGPMRGRSDVTLVENRTGLDGRYDMTLHIEEDPSGEPSTGTPSPASVKHALETELGLTLTPAKIARKIAVIDHVDRTPASN